MDVNGKWLRSIDLLTTAGHADTASGARAAVFPLPKRQRSSYGPAHEARRKAFYDSKEPRTNTGAPSTQVGAGTKAPLGNRFLWFTLPLKSLHRPLNGPQPPSPAIPLTVSQPLSSGSAQRARHCGLSTISVLLGAHWRGRCVFECNCVRI